MVETRNLQQYAEIHATKRYGDTGRNKLKFVAPWVQVLQPRSVLDYGAGQSLSVKYLRCDSIETRDRYDPAIPAIATVPRNRYDLVLCIDVMEHIDENEVPAIVGDIARLGENAIFVIDLKLAGTVLPNGENAHSTVRPAEWWVSQIAKFYPQAEIGTSFKTRVLVKTWHSSPLERVRHGWNLLWTIVTRPYKRSKLAHIS